MRRTSKPSPSTLSLGPRPAPWQRALSVALLCGSALTVLAAGSLRGDTAQSEAPALASPPAPVVIPARGAPWGALHAIDLWVRPPKGLARAEECGAPPVPWRLPGTAAPALQHLLSQAGLDRPDATPALQDLLASARCDSAGCVLDPSAEQRLALPAAARALLYPELARHLENPLQAYAFRFRHDQAEGWLAAIDVSPALRAQVRGLLYPDGDTLAFSDQDSLCRGLPQAERAALVRALTTVHATLLHLRVEQDQPAANRGAAASPAIEALVSYWGAGGREEQVRPLLSALARRAGGGTIDVEHLLPDFAAAHLNQHPTAAQPAYNCHYTALNFFRAEPDPRPLSIANVVPVLESEFQEVPFPDRLGDVIVITKQDGTLLHSMAYVAADYVFTKNGYAHAVPFVLSRIDDVRALYQGTSTTERAFRRTRP